MSKYEPEFSGGYAQDFLVPARIKRQVAFCIKLIRRKKLKFDSIAFRGLSGAMIAPMVALKLKKTLIAVRKEESHSVRPIEGDIKSRTYIIIDDFVCSGNTVRKIVRAINKWFGKTKPKCVGAILYVSETPFRKVKDNGDLWTR